MFAGPSHEPSAPVRGERAQEAVTESARTMAQVGERIGRGLATLMGDTLSESIPDGMLALVARLETAGAGRPPGA